VRGSDWRAATIESVENPAAPRDFPRLELHRAPSNPAPSPPRRWFRLYWTCGVGSGAHVLVNGLVDVVREMAERAER